MLSIGIVGAGGIARTHAAAYLQHAARCRIAAVFDIDVQRADRFVRELNLEGAACCRTLKELQESGLDLVSICTPPSVHADATIQCLAAGIHVLCEKPMAPSLEECDGMLQAARRSGRILSIVAQNRFLNPYWKLKKVLDSGLAGAINYLQVSSAWWRGLNYYNLWWRGTWASEGGGCTLNHAVHHIDMALWYGGRPDMVKAFVANTSHGNSEVEDLSSALLAYSSGSLGHITGSVVHHGEQQEILIQAENAMLRHPWQVLADTQKENGFTMPDEKTRSLLEDFWKRLEDLNYQGHSGQIDDVLSAIETGKPVLVDGEAGRRTIELIAAIYSAAFLDRTERLPIETGHPFYSRDGMLRNVRKFHEKTGSVREFSGDITVGQTVRRKGT
jgi:UDP-N-acetyl-2-amino-2-deoxyglucuronate dehydrogenase